MFEMDAVSLAAIRDRYPAYGGKVAKNERLDLVVRAAQSLFAQDVWVNQVAIASELGISRPTICWWSTRKGSQVSFLLYLDTSSCSALWVYKPRLLNTAPSSDRCRFSILNTFCLLACRAGRTLCHTICSLCGSSRSSSAWSARCARASG
jgi:hypothetical protein